MKKISIITWIMLIVSIIMFGFSIVLLFIEIFKFNTEFNSIKWIFICGTFSAMFFRISFSLSMDVTKFDVESVAWKKISKKATFKVLKVLPTEDDIKDFYFVYICDNQIKEYLLAKVYSPIPIKEGSKYVSVGYIQGVSIIQMI